MSHSNLVSKVTDCLLYDWGSFPAEGRVFFCLPHDIKTGSESHGLVSNSHYLTYLASPPLALYTCKRTMKFGIVS